MSILLWIGIIIAGWWILGKINAKTTILMWIAIISIGWLIFHWLGWIVASIYAGIIWFCIYWEKRGWGPTC